MKVRQSTGSEAKRGGERVKSVFKAQTFPFSRAPSNSPPRRYCANMSCNTRKNGHHRFRIELPERFEQAPGIDRAQLIEGNRASAASEAASRPPRVQAPAGGHGRDDHGPEMLVQFVRRHDDAGSRLFDFTA
jgi:hypothetical protein